MVPTGFNEENGLAEPPFGMSPDECDTLSVWRGWLDNVGGTPVTVSCWKMTKEELEEVIKTGRIWLMVMGHTMLPTMVLGLSPFEDEKEEKEVKKNEDQK